MSEALTHLDAQGRARMVDVGAKPATRRRAVARARLSLRAETLRRIAAGRMPKGDVLAVARVAGIMAAKRTPELIPLCHAIPVTSVAIDFDWREPADGEGRALLEVEAAVETVDRTGVEMEALVAASLAALTIYDMCKAVDRGMSVESVRLVEKSGGRSGHYRREGEASAGKTAGSTKTVEAGDGEANA